MVVKYLQPCALQLATKMNFWGIAIAPNFNFHVSQYTTCRCECLKLNAGATCAKEILAICQLLCSSYIIMFQVRKHVECAMKFARLAKIAAVDVPRVEVHTCKCFLFVFFFFMEIVVSLVKFFENTI